MSNYFKHKMRSKSPGEIVGWVILGIVGIAALAILLGFVIMWLWNALLPATFGFVTITYWQAVGLFILFRIFFGGMGGGSSNKHSKKKHQCEDENSKTDFSKWEKYDQYWAEEGEVAYNAFLERKRNTENEV